MQKQNEVLGRRELTQVALLALTFVPFAAVVFAGIGRDQPLVVAAVTGFAIVAAALFLSWATETLETVIPVAGALAILALIEVLPEYSFEVVLAWQQRVELATASMTGSNRLLLGLGWPLIFFTALLAARLRRQRFTEITLSTSLASDIAFLTVASLYALLIVAKGTLALYDGVILAVLYVAYVVRALRYRPEEEHDEEEGEEEELEPGMAGKLQRLPGPQRALVVAVFLSFGATVILFGAEPFIVGLIATAREMGVSEFFLIQWVAPFLAEFPESLTAFLWASTVLGASRGLANLVSAKLNQWTLLVATIPFVYSLSVGYAAEIHLTQLSRDEILLTAAQTVLGVVILGRLRFTLTDALLLLSLWALQFALPDIRGAVTIAYFALGLGYVVVARSPLPLLRALRPTRGALTSDAD